MNIDGPNSDFLEQFRTISNKLKKRFLRKPNVTEASAAFSQLALQCEQQDLPAYAGLCWIAAARCEGSLSNAPSEVTCLLRAARLFTSHEARDRLIGCPGPANEHLQAALNCYTYANTRCTEAASPLSVGISLEISECLRRFNKPDESRSYLSTTSQNMHLKIHIYEKIASIQVETGQYTAALLTFTELTEYAATTPDLQLRCEISCIFLILILRPAATRLSTSLTKLLEKYMWTSYPDIQTGNNMSENLFILLQSLVMTCQSQDRTCLPELEADLYPLLTKESRILLRVLIKQYI